MRLCLWVFGHLDSLNLILNFGYFCLLPWYFVCWDFAKGNGIVVQNIADGNVSEMPNGTKI